MSGTLNLKKIKLGDNADTSKNFVISVPAVADGTLTIERENGTDVLTVDAAGKVTFPGNVVPVFNATGGIQSVANNADILAVFGTEVFDTANCYDPSTSKFKPSVAGYYKIEAKFALPDWSLSGGYVRAIIRKNGSTVMDYVYGPLNMYATFMLHNTLYLNGTTDEVYLTIGNASGATHNILAQYFQGFLVRAA